MNHFHSNFVVVTGGGAASYVESQDIISVVMWLGGCVLSTPHHLRRTLVVRALFFGRDRDHGCHNNHCRPAPPRPAQRPGPTHTPGHRRLGGQQGCWQCHPVVPEGSGSRDALARAVCCRGPALMAAMAAVTITIIMIVGSTRENQLALSGA